MADEERKYLSKYAGAQIDALLDKVSTMSNPMILKGRVDTEADLQRIQNPQPGWMYAVGLTTDTVLKEFYYTTDHTWEFMGTISITVDSTITESSNNPVTSAAIYAALEDKQDVSSAVTGVKGDSEVNYHTGNVNITKSNIGLGNVTNDAQIKKLATSTANNIAIWGNSTGDQMADSGKALEDSTSGLSDSDAKVPTSKAVKTELDKKMNGKSSGTTQNNLMKFGSNGYTAEDAGVAVEDSSGSLSDSDTKVPTSKLAKAELDKKMNGKASGTTQNNLMKFGTNGYTAEDAGVSIAASGVGVTDDDTKVPTSKSVMNYVNGQVPKFTYDNGYIAVDYGTQQ